MRWEMNEIDRVFFESKLIKSKKEKVFRRMKQMKKLLLPVLPLAVVSFGTTLAHADGVNFSVAPTLGANQVRKDVGYFDLLLKPEQSQTLKFTISNSSSKTIKVDTSFGTAYTSSSGTVGYAPNTVKPDPSLTIDLKNYVKLPKQVTVPANTSVPVTATVTMPKDNFTGVIAGGFNFEQADDDSKAAKTSGVTITNKYRYVIGLVMQESKTKVAPNLTLGKVGPDQVNSRNVISANLTNNQKAYLLDMNTNATVTKYGDAKVKYTFANAMMEMAPNSNFDLAIPVSLPGVLNGQTSQPLKPGKYHLAMTVYGNKDTAGKYQAMVNGQVTKYDYKWTFSKDFTVTGQKAAKLNAADPTIDHSSKINWLVIIGIIIIILLLLILIFLVLFKRRKKDDETDEEAAKQ